MTSKNTQKHCKFYSNILNFNKKQLLTNNIITMIMTIIMIIMTIIIFIIIT